MFRIFHKFKHWSTFWGKGSQLFHYPPRKILRLECRFRQKRTQPENKKMRKLWKKPRRGVAGFYRIHTRYRFFTRRTLQLDRLWGWNSSSIPSGTQRIPTKKTKPSSDKPDGICNEIDENWNHHETIFEKINLKKYNTTPCPPRERGRLQLKNPAHWHWRLRIWYRLACVQHETSLGRGLTSLHAKAY